MEIPEIADIGSMSAQLLDDETGEVLTTAPCYRCANRMLGSVQFPQAGVTYRAIGNDINGRPFSASPSKSATFVQDDGAKFQVTLGGENEAEQGQRLSLPLLIHNHDINDAHYTFTTEPTTDFRIIFRPTSLLVHSGANGSVYMIILPLSAEPSSSYTFTAYVTDGCVIHSVSKTVFILMSVRLITACSYFL